MLGIVVIVENGDPEDNDKSGGSSIGSTVDLVNKLNSSDLVNLPRFHAHSLARFAMRRLGFFAVILLTAVRPYAVAAEPGVPPAPAQTAVQSGLRYLAKEGVQWMEVRKCSSCHHAPLMIWALNEAKNHGYAIDAKALADVSMWVLAKEDPAKVFVKSPPKKDEPPAKELSQAPLMLALAFAAIREPEADQGKGRVRFLERVRAEQDDNGSWHLRDGNRRPPMMADPDVMTQWALLALTHAPAADNPTAVPSRTLA